MYIIRDMRQRNISQMIVYLLGGILMARIAVVKQKQVHKFLEFERFVRVLSSHRSQHCCSCLRAAPGLGVAKVQPRIHTRSAGPVGAKNSELLQWLLTFQAAAVTDDLQWASPGPEGKGEQNAQSLVGRFSLEAHNLESCCHG